MPAGRRRGAEPTAQRSDHGHARRAGDHLSAAITCICDPQDQVSFDAQLRTLADRPGVLVAEITPGSRGRGALVYALLRGLDKNVRLSGTGRDLNDLADYATCWLAADPPEHLIIARAHLLDRPQWEVAAGLAAQLDAGLWLTCGRALHRGQKTMLRDWAGALIAPADHRWPAISPPSARTADEQDNNPQTRLPVLPAADFLTFRSTCRQLLDAAAFAAVDEIWGDAYRRALGPAIHHGEDPAAAQQLLRDLLGTHDSVSARLAAARGAQAAYFVCGHLLKLDAQRLAADTAADRLDAPTAELLGRYPNPRWACLAAVALVCEGPADALAAIDIGDLSADAAAIRFDEHTLPVTPAARPLLEAGRIWRLREGAGARDPLFAYRPGGGGRYQAGPLTRATSHSLQMNLRRIAAETGLSFSALTATRRRSSGADGWLSQRGFALHRVVPGPASVPAARRGRDPLAVAA